jgi:hypothetical protein
MINCQETSRQAWRDLVPISAKLDFAIMTALAEAGPEGLICQDIEGRLGRSHQSVSGNLRHLVEKGRVVATGEHGRTTSNRRAMKWKVAA